MCENEAIHVSQIVTMRNKGCRVESHKNEKMRRVGDKRQLENEAKRDPIAIAQSTSDISTAPWDQ